MTKVSAPYGQAADPQALEEALDKTPGARLVLVTHNETSTGVTNDLRTLAAVVRSRPNGGPLLVVDGVSSVGSIPLLTDEWGCDVVVSGSQKGWMAPPGLAFVAISPRAWEVVEQATCPRYYWDFRQARKYGQAGQTPWTPAVSVLYALRVGLQLIMQEGLENVYARHRRVAQYTRDGGRALGFELFADPAHASDTVTCLKVPAGVDAAALTARLREQGVVIAGGQGKLKGQVIRIGHLGYVNEADIDGVFQALRVALGKG